MRHSATIVGGILVGMLGWWLPGMAQTQPATPSSETPLIGSIRGPDLYKAYCASCHGATAKGNGPMAKVLKTPPPDLTRIAVRNKREFPMQRISQIISGELQVGGHGNREMPVWGPIFSRVEADRDFGLVRIDNLTQYLRQIQQP